MRCECFSEAAGTQRLMLLTAALLSTASVQPVELSVDDCPSATVAAARDVWGLRDASAALEAAGRLSEADGCKALAVAKYGSEPVAHFDVGRMWQRHGQLEQATAAYEQALVLDPAFVHAANNLGAVYKQRGRYADAERVLAKAIEQDDQFAGLEYNLGMVLVKAHSEHRAVEHLQAALRKAKPPEPPPRWHDDLAAILEALHRTSEAMEQSAVAVALDPANSRFAKRLDRLRSDHDTRMESGGSLREAIAAAGELEAVGKASEAYAAYERLASAHPTDDDILYRLAWNRYQQKDYYPAHEHLSAALALAPMNRDYLAFMGVLLHETGNWEEAVEYLKEALASFERDVDGDGRSRSNEEARFENEEFEIWYNLGIVHKDLGNHQSAAKSFRKAFRLSSTPSPNGDVSQDVVQIRKADRMKFLALAVEQSNKACDWRHLHELLPLLLKRLQAGDAVALRATDPYESLLYVNSAATSLRIAEEHVAAATRNKKDDAVVPVRLYRDWLHIAKSLRIGILSADMRHHPVAQTLLGVLQSIREHDGSRVHVVVFSMCPEKPDDNVQQEIRSQVDSWHNIHATTDEAAAQMVADEGIHIMLEMQGHTLHRRIGIAMRRPAPVAISMQGFPASTGISPETLPYLLADNVVLPPELATPDAVSEQVMYMPFSFIACGYRRSLSIAVRQTNEVDQPDPGRSTSRTPQQRPSGSATSLSIRRRLSWVDVENAWGQELDHLRLDAIVHQLRSLLTQYPALNASTELRQVGLSILAAPTTGVERRDMAQQASTVENDTEILLRLCANNRAAKVDATAMTLWSNVLRRVHRKHQIWMDGQFHDAKTNLLVEAAARGLVNGVDAGRDSTYEHYMQRLGQCDIFLDTLTYGAHTVGLDALYMGLPIVTVAGGQMANRVGASLMTAVGAGLHVEPSLKAYEDAAVAHSNVRARQKDGGYRQTADRLSRTYTAVLPTPSRASPLFDASAFAEDLVSAMQTAWEHERTRHAKKQ